MQKKHSKNKLTGQLLLMQNDLMSKLANLAHETPTKATDELGFSVPSTSNSHDALQDLIFRSKKAANNKKSKKKEQQGCFLTGVGLGGRQPQETKEETQTNAPSSRPTLNADVQPEMDANEMLKELIMKNQEDDLAELRRMIKQTGESLQSYSRNFAASKKSILQMADRYSNQIDTQTLERMQRYHEWDARQLDNIDQAGFSSSNPILTKAGKGRAKLRHH